MKPSRNPKDVYPWQPNRWVGYRLRKARERRGWSQAETAERINQYFRGAPKRKQWAEQAVWRAEKSYTAEDRRVRSFDADEIQAFAMVFGLPVSYFFLAPPASETGQPVPAALLLPLITVTPEGTPGWREYHDAVGELLADDEKLIGELREWEGRLNVASRGGRAVSHMYRVREGSKS